MKRAVLVMAVSAALAGCALAPRYAVPRVETPARYDGDWLPATPADLQPRGEWWRVYGDPQLDGLEHQLLRDSPELAVASARYDEARALATEASAGLFPTVGAAGLATTDRQSDNRPLRSASQPARYRDYLFGLSASYEIDLWGRVRSQATAGRAFAAASQADVEAARLSLTTELASEYLALAGVDAELRLLVDTVHAYEQALRLASARHDGGLASGLEVARAQTQLQATAAQLTDVTSRRQLLSHAIARLVGAPASGFVIQPIATLPVVPAIPPGIPSTLAQRRPDIAAAERRVALANAQVGVARAAFFPKLTLSALAGYESTAGDGLFAAPNRLWAVGPSAALLLFDAGARRAEVLRARAALEESAGRYRGSVLGAFREIEDSLSQLHLLADEQRQQGAATDAARQALDLATQRYESGAVSYLDVVVAQSTALQTERGLLAIDVRRLSASVQLIRGLGGSWTDADASLTSR